MNNFARIARNSRGFRVAPRRTQISSTSSRHQLWHQFSTTSTSSAPHTTQPVGIAAVMQNATKPSSTPRATIFDEFALHDRVAIVTGGNQNLGLEQSLALSEAGARVVYCIDLPSSPSEAFNITADHIQKLGISSLRLSDYFNCLTLSLRWSNGVHQRRCHESKDDVGYCRENWRQRRPS